MRDFLTGLAHDRNSSLQHPDYQLHPNTSPTLSKKSAVIDWCYRKITPLTYTRSVGLAPPPGLGAHLIERYRYETSLLPLALRSSLRIHA